MRILLILLAVSAFSLNSFSQTPDLKALWEQIKVSLSDGSFNPDNWGGLDGLGGINVGDFDMSQLPGGFDKVNELFDAGGIFGDMFGDIFGGELMSAMGIEELHNDASLNSNIIWGILFTMKIMHPHIKERQRTIMSQQDSINMRIKQLYELELLTVKYLSKTQGDAVNIERDKDIAKLKDDIAYLYPQCMSLCDAGGFTPSKVALTLKFATHLTKMQTKINDFAKYDGNKNLLNNQDRDEIITYMYDTMHEMRGTLSLAYRELLAGSRWKQFENLNTKIK
ncbi:MAG: hypothetical protein LBP63_08275 [Prevotellaceae bacterium]|nr:hypothetical protein [Prevotellaceae bacterium]